MPDAVHVGAGDVGIFFKTHIAFKNFTQEFLSRISFKKHKCGWVARVYCMIAVS